MANHLRKISDHCDVVCLDNNRIVKASVLDFKEHKTLIVVLNQSIKLTLKWNGRKYLGNSSGLEFSSDGPTVTSYKVR